jgi:hypothetical protein
MGAALESELRLYLSYPGIPRPRRQRALKQLLSSGEVVETKVKDAPGRWLCLARDLDALAAAGRRRQPSTGVTLLAPFDSFMWHRDRITKLFGFDYRIEVYVPEPKRVYGYYVLPILADGHFIGRALGNETYFERAAHVGDFVGAQARKVLCELGRRVAPAAHDAQRRRRGFADGDRVRCGRPVRAPGALGQSAEVKPVEHGRVDGAEHGAAVDNERDVDRELAVALDELFRAVEWVDEPIARPTPACRVVLGRRFLGKQRDRGVERREIARDDRVSHAVGFRERRIVALPRYREVAAVDLEDGATCGARNVAHGVE